MYGHKFCDVSEARYGVALLNDAKYGYSVRDGNMGLSLLKASKFPDHEADMKVHKFIYSMLPHDRPLEESTVFDEAHRLNTPLWVTVLNKPAEGDEDYAVNRDAVNALQPIQIDQANINVMALKQSEDSDSVYILRINEDRGEQVTTKLSFKFGAQVKNLQIVNSLEEEAPMEEAAQILTAFDKEAQEVTLHVRPYTIISMALHF